VSDRFDHSIEATGTQWIISLWFDGSKEDSQMIWESVLSVMKDFEKKYSRFDSNSFLSGLSKEAGSISVPSHLVSMLKIYQGLYQLSNGGITPLGGDMITQLGYDREYRFRPSGEDVIVPNFDSAVHIASDHEIQIQEGLHFDIGALGKGYLIDLVMAQLLQEKRINRVLINAGGDIAHHAHSGERARIALENPDDTSQALGVIEIGNESLASSASNKRRWGADGEHHHIYNPQDGESVAGIKASWVIHEQAVMADALATSLFLVDADKLSEKYSFDYAYITETKKIRYAQRFKKAFFA